MYYYNVVICDEYPFPDNSLVFTFLDMEEAMKFARYILEKTDYHVNILNLKDNENEQ